MSTKRLTLRDDDGTPVGHGDFVRFSFGTPSFEARGRVVRRGRSLFVVLAPSVKPRRTNLRSLRRHVGCWYRDTTP